MNRIGECERGCIYLGVRLSINISSPLAISSLIGGGRRHYRIRTVLIRVYKGVGIFARGRMYISRCIELTAVRYARIRNKDTKVLIHQTVSRIRLVRFTHAHPLPLMMHARTSVPGVPGVPGSLPAVTSRVP